MIAALERLMIVTALGLAAYAVLGMEHYPTHVYINQRLFAIESWIRGRCIGDTLQKACPLREPKPPEKAFTLNIQQ